MLPRGRGGGGLMGVERPNSRTPSRRKFGLKRGGHSRICMSGWGVCVLVLFLIFAFLFTDGELALFCLDPLTLPSHSHSLPPSRPISYQQQRAESPWKERRHPSQSTSFRRSTPAPPIPAACHDSLSRSSSAQLQLRRRYSSEIAKMSLQMPCWTS